MEDKGTTSVILLSALIALILLIGWSFVGPALGGTGAGSADGPDTEPDPGEGEAEAEAEAEAEGSESERDLERTRSDGTTIEGEIQYTNGKGQTR